MDLLFPTLIPPPGHTFTPVTPPPFEAGGDTVPGAPGTGTGTMLPPNATAGAGGMPPGGLPPGFRPPVSMVFPIPTLAMSIFLTIIFTVATIITIYKTLKTRYLPYRLIYSFVSAKILAYAFRAVLSEHPLLGWVAASNIAVASGFWGVFVVHSKLMSDWYLRIYDLTELPRKWRIVRNTLYFLIFAISIVGIYAAVQLAIDYMHKSLNPARKASSYGFVALFSIEILVLIWLRIYAHKEITGSRKEVAGGIRFWLILIPSLLLLTKCVYRAAIIGHRANEDANKEWVYTVFDPTFELLALLLWLSSDLKALFAPLHLLEEEKMKKLQASEEQDIGSDVDEAFTETTEVNHTRSHIPAAIMARARASVESKPPTLAIVQNKSIASLNSKKSQQSLRSHRSIIIRRSADNVAAGEKRDDIVYLQPLNAGAVSEIGGATAVNSSGSDDDFDEGLMGVNEEKTVFIRDDARTNRSHDGRRSSE
ncbi:hypothetical protein GQ42DRAFT_179543 [Ramicandelaber brevisporus]|nr:hypothetical protein GQ42DRAFT_179543 [Ramicandelaber brevisporus]